MSKIRIITDSASDISTAEEQKYNINPSVSGNDW